MIKRCRNPSSKIAVLVALAMMLATMTRGLGEGSAQADDRTPSLDAAFRVVEEAVAGLWADTLRVPRIGATENFFKLGGHSLLATQLLSRLKGLFPPLHHLV